MADTAAHLVDHVLPHAPARLWVLSFAFRIRLLLASSPRLCAAVRGIVTRTLLGWLEQRALSAAAAERSARPRSSDCAPSARPEPQFAARSGAVVFAQRLGSAPNLDLHFHALLLDGAFVSPSERPAPSFQAAAPLTDTDVGELVEPLARRITRWADLLRRVLADDVLTCPHCGGPRRLIAQRTDPIVVRRILAHLGHPTEPPRPAPARSREQLDFA